MVRSDAHVPPSCFAPFHNINCKHGFVYLTSDSDLKIAQLPLDDNSGITHAEGWNVRKVSLRPSATAHPTIAGPIVYIPEYQIYAVVVTQYVPVQPTLKTKSAFKKEGEEDKEEEEEEEKTLDPSVPPAQQKKFEIRLISPHNWEILDRFPMDDLEHICDMKLLQLRTTDPNNENNHSRNSRDKVDDSLKPILAVGTSYFEGEDVSCKGRIILFEFIKQKMTKNEEEKPNLKLLLCKEEKGAVTALCDLEGYLVLASGPKILVYIFDMENNPRTLVGKAFFDAKLYIVSLKSIKNYLLFGDMFKGIFFLRWLEPQRTLALLGKDFNPIEVTSVDFLLREQSLSFVCTDDHSNLQMLEYSPQDVESRGGEMLLAKSQFHVGGKVSELLCLPVTYPGRQSVAYHVLYFGTTSGGIGTVFPIPEQVFRRLSMIAHKLQTIVPHFSGLNPKAYRKFKPNYRFPSRQRRDNNMIDGRLVRQFLDLDLSLQSQIARQVGMVREDLVNTILEVESLYQVV